MGFENRDTAGRELAARLLHLKQRNPVVLALPRGGVEVAAPIAAALDAPLGVLIVRKIGAPMQPELAIGALVDGDAPVSVFNEDILRVMGLSAEERQRAVDKALAEVAARRARFGDIAAVPDCAGKTVIVVDDGIATGATVRAALAALRRRMPALLVLAVPVAPQETLDILASDADAIVCLETPDPFYAVGAHYRNFDQVTDETVVRIVKAAQRHRASHDAPDRTR